MKKAKKYLAYTLIFILGMIVLILSYVGLALPDIGKPEDIQVAVSPARAEHGKYLAMHVAVCMDCHSTRDWNTFAGPVDTNLLGGGGEHFNEKIGFPGDVFAPNITPYNLKNWTDGEIFRAITSGVKKDGSAIFPLMPWQSYRKMDREDVYDIIAYIRTLAPQEHEYSKRKLNFPLNFLVNTMPQKAELSKRPSENDTVNYGGYLVGIAGCKDCHSPDKNGKLIEGKEFAGGHEFKLPGIILHSANITQDMNDGIGSWTKDEFVGRFKQFTSDNYTPRHVGKNEFQTIMPWVMYSGMKTSDLEAMYAYMKTIKPIKNKVNIFDKEGN